MLGNAAGFPCRNRCVPDRVQKGGFTVVNVSHNHHNRGAGLQLLFFILVYVNEFFLNRDDNFLFNLAAHFLRNNGGGLKVDELADRRHYTVFHQAFNHFSSTFFHAGRKFPYGNFIGNLHFHRGFFGNFKL